MEMYDDELIRFEAEGAPPLPDTDEHGYIENAGARIWYASYGSGLPVVRSSIPTYSIAPVRTEASSWTRSVTQPC